MSLPRDIRERLSTAVSAPVRKGERHHVVAIAFDDDGRFSIVCNTREGVEIDRIAGWIRKIAEEVEKP